MSLPFPPPPVLPDPRVVEVAREFKSGLLYREAAQIEEMTRRWLQIEAVIDGLATDLADELAARAAAGETVKLWKIYRLQRYKELIAQIREEVDKYNDYAERLITRNQAVYGNFGIQNAAELIRQSQIVAYGQIVVSFDILPATAIEFMTGLAGDGSPLRALLADAFPDAVKGLLDELIRSTSLGINPRETARRMMRGFGVGLDRALNIARTEQLRVYREASRFQYTQSGIVRGYKRVATHDGRVCAACILAEGTFYPVDNYFEEHPQGRCALIPVLNGVDAPAWDSGIPWFIRQPESYQRQILGSGRFDLYKSGQISLNDIIQRKHDPTWGGSLTPTPLYKLRGFESPSAMREADKIARRTPVEG